MRFPATLLLVCVPLLAKTGSSAPIFTLVPIRDIKIKAQGSTVAFAPDSRHILAGQTWVSGDGYASPAMASEIDVWDAKTGAAVKRVRAQHGLTAAAYSWNGKYLATTYDGGEIRISDARGGRTIRSFKSGAESISYLCFSPDSLTLAASTVVNGSCASGVGSLLLFSVQTGKQRPKEYRGVFNGLNDFAGSFARWFTIHPNMRQVAVCTEQGILIRGVTGKGKRRFLQNSSGFDSLAISRDGQLVSGISSDGDLALWDFSTGSRLARSENFIERIWAAEIEFSPDGRSLVVSSDVAGKIRVLRVKRSV